MTTEEREYFRNYLVEAARHLGSAEAALFRLDDDEWRAWEIDLAPMRHTIGGYEEVLYRLALKLSQAIEDES